MPRIEKPSVAVVADRREALAGTTEPCRCYGCGSPPMACGTLCADCSWEDHLAGMAHTGDPFDPPVAVPSHCHASRQRERRRLLS